MAGNFPEWLKDTDPGKPNQMKTKTKSRMEKHSIPNHNRKTSKDKKTSTAHREKTQHPQWNNNEADHGLLNSSETSQR